MQYTCYSIKHLSGPNPASLASEWCHHHHHRKKRPVLIFNNNCKMASSDRDENSAKPSKKKGFILFLVLLVLGGVAAALYFFRDDIFSGPTTKSTDDTTPTPPTPTVRPGSAPTFAPIPTATMAPTDRRTGLISRILAMDDLSIDQNALDWLVDTDTWYPIPFNDIDKDVALMLERYALAALSMNTSGERWWINHNGWLSTTTSVCNWYGIECLQQHVVKLELLDNGLVGSLPAEMQYLPELESLIIERSYELQKSIPSELASLTKLKHLSLEECYITGSIPSEISAWTSLTSLNLKKNVLNGKIPSTINQMVALQSLDARENELVGPFPSISALGALTSLVLTGNKINGQLPSMEMLTNLEILNLGTW